MHLLRMRLHYTLKPQFNLWLLEPVCLPYTQQDVSIRMYGTVAALRDLQRNILVGTAHCDVSATSYVTHCIGMPAVELTCVRGTAILPGYHVQHLAALWPLHLWAWSMPGLMAIAGRVLKELVETTESLP